jgi:hypothetical protein
MELSEGLGRLLDSKMKEMAEMVAEQLAAANPATRGASALLNSGTMTRRTFTLPTMKQSAAEGPKSHRSVRHSDDEGAGVEEGDGDDGDEGQWHHIPRSHSVDSFFFRGVCEVHLLCFIF